MSKPAFQDDKAARAALHAVLADYDVDADTADTLCPTLADLEKLVADVRAASASAPTAASLPGEATGPRLNYRLSSSERKTAAELRLHRLHARQRGKQARDIAVARLNETLPADSKVSATDMDAARQLLDEISN